MKRASCGPLLFTLRNQRAWALGGARGLIARGRGGLGRLLAPALLAIGGLRDEGDLYLVCAHVGGEGGGRAEERRERVVGDEEQAARDGATSERRKRVWAEAREKGMAALKKRRESQDVKYG